MNMIVIWHLNLKDGRFVCIEELLYLVNFVTILIFLQFVSIDNFLFSFSCQQLVEAELLKSDKLSNFKIYIKLFSIVILVMYSKISTVHNSYDW